MLSASQVSTFRDCPRKWAWQYLAGLEPTPHPSAEIGTQAHAYLEEYIQSQTLPEGNDYASEMARAAIPFVDKIETEKIVEDYFELETAAGVFRGYIDLQYKDPDTGLWVVHDYKTTGNLRWAKTPKDLQSDIQATLYTKAVCENQKIEKALARWMYITREKRPKIHIVEQIRRLPDIDRTLGPILETGKQMQGLHERKPSIFKITGNTSACNKYGGCSFLRDCFPLKQGKAMTKENILESLRKKQAALKDAKAKAEAEAKAKADALAAEEKVLAEAEAKAKEEARAKAEELARKAAEAKAKAEEAKAKAAASATAINPPEEAKRPRGRPRKEGTSPAQPASQESSATVKGWMLCINCTPGKLSNSQKILAAENVVGPVVTSILEDQQITNFRTAKIDGGWADGDAVLRKKLKTYLEQNPLPPGSVVVANDTMAGIISQTALEVLRENATVVVYGIK